MANEVTNVLSFPVSNNEKIDKDTMTKAVMSDMCEDNGIDEKRWKEIYTDIFEALW